MNFLLFPDKYRFTPVLPLCLLILSVAGCNFTSDVSPEIHIDKAKAFIEQGQENAAVIELKNALQKDTNQPEARWLLGRIYLKYGNGEAAEKEFDRAMSLGFEHPQLGTAVLQTKLLQRNYREVLEQTDSQAAQQDTPAEIHIIRGNAYVGLQQFEDAQSSYKKALSLDPQAANALLGQARIAAIKNNLDTARQLIERGQNIAPENVELWLLKGQISLFENKPEAAEQAFAEATRLADYNFMGPLGQIQALFMQDKYAAALEPIETIEARNSKLPLTRYYRAIIALQNNKAGEAKDYLRQALQIASNHTQSQLLLARILYQEGQTEEARHKLNAFLRQQPDHPLANRLMAAIQMKLNETEQAIQRLEGLEDKDASAMAMLGNMYAQTGQVEMGQSALEDALELNPDDPAVQTQLALYKLNAGDVQTSIAELEAVNRKFPEYAPAYISLVMTHVKAEQSKKAIQVAESFVANNPDKPQSYNMLGFAYQAVDNTETARRNYNKALELDPEYIPALTNLARLESQLGNTEAVNNHYQKIHELDENNLGALLYLARRAADNGNQKKTLALLQQASEAHPEAVEPRIYLGRYHLAKQEYTALEEVVSPAYKLAPDNPDVLLLLGQAQRFNGKDHHSLETLEELVRLKPQEAVSYYQLALTQINLGNYDSARNNLDKSLELRPDYPDALTTAAKLAIQQGQQELAKEYSDKLNRIDSDSARVRAHLLGGDISLSENRPEDAVIAYEKAWSQTQNDFSILTKLTSAYDLTGNTDKSLQILGDWLNKHPDDRQAQLLLAQTYQRIGQLNQAKQQYKSILEVDPDNLVALNNLAWLYIEDDIDLALEMAHKAHELSPRSADILDTLGWALVNDKKTEHGIRYLRSALDQKPDSPVIRYHYAYSLAASGDELLARRELEKLLEEHKNFEDRSKAEELLTSLK